MGECAFKTVSGWANLMMIFPVEVAPNSPFSLLLSGVMLLLPRPLVGTARPERHPSSSRRLPPPGWATPGKTEAGDRLGLLGLFVHRGTNLTELFRRKKWAADPTSLRTLKRWLPSEGTILKQLRELANSSCAVVGASGSLRNCTGASDICRHDAILYANDHAEVRRRIGCERVDAQVANHDACVWDASTGGMVTYKRLVTGEKRKMQCETEPRRFRFRHEWNPRELARGATRAWLSSGILTDRVHGEVRRHGGGKCCATAGGVAIGLALHVCQRITLFGVGGLGRGHVEDEATNKEAPPRRQYCWGAQHAGRARLDPEPGRRGSNAMHLTRSYKI